MAAAPFLFTLTLLGSGAGCAQPGAAAVPHELVGVWTTPAPQYDGRSLQVSPTEVTFGTGGQQFVNYPIRRVDISREHEQLLYTIRYANGGGQEYALALYYDTANGGLITFAHQPQVRWVRKE